MPSDNELPRMLLKIACASRAPHSGVRFDPAVCIHSFIRMYVLYLLLFTYLYLPVWYDDDIGLHFRWNGVEWSGVGYLGYKKMRGLGDVCPE